MIVYSIVCEQTGMQYIGQHKGNNLLRYWRQNVSCALRGSNFKPRLYNAIRKYGPNNFLHKILVIVDSLDEANRYERGLIASRNTKSPNGYNLTEGGDGVRGLAEESLAKLRAALKGNSHTLGLRHTALARKHMSEAQMGHKSSCTPEGDEKRRQKMKGRKRPPFSAQWKQNMSLAAKRSGHTKGNRYAAGGTWNKGRVRTPETRLKISLARLGKPLSEEHKKKIAEGLRRRRDKQLADQGTLALWG